MSWAKNIDIFYSWNSLSAYSLIPGWYFYQWYIRWSFYHTTLVLISQMILLPISDCLIWSPRQWSFEQSSASPSVRGRRNCPASLTTNVYLWPMAMEAFKIRKSKRMKQSDLFFYLNRGSLLGKGRRCVEGTGKGLAGQGPQQRCCLHAFYLLIWNNSKIRVK